MKRIPSEKGGKKLPKLYPFGFLKMWANHAKLCRVTQLHVLAKST
jgi:hypothetical protein